MRSKEGTEGAIRVYAEAIKLDPMYPPAYAGLSRAYCEAMIRFGHPRTLVNDAVALAQKSVELDPTFAGGYNALSSAYFAKGDLRGSLAPLQKACELDPKNVDALSRIGFLHLDLGELDAAMRWSHRALDAGPTSTFALAYVQRNIARLHTMFGEYAVAQDWLNKCLTVEPDFPSARVLRVYLCHLRGEAERAWEEARRMLERRPEDPETLNFVADAALLRGDHSQARSLFEHAIELGPDSRNFYRARRAKTGLGFVLWKRGDRVSATKLFEERIAVRTNEHANGLNAWGPPYELAAICAVRGHSEDALRWLQHAAEVGWREPLLARIDPLLENLQGSAGLEKILAEVGEVIRIMKVRAEGANWNSSEPYRA